MSNAQLEEAETAISSLLDARAKVVHGEANLRTLLDDPDLRALIDA